MPRFKSITWRVISLHVVALAVTSIVLPAALYWGLNRETNNLHHTAMREQAASIAHNLVLQADGKWTLSLSPDLQAIFSRAYGRYAYAVLDDTGEVLFSSFGGRMAVFPDDPRSMEVTFLEVRRDNATISGASVPNMIGGRAVWVQVGENLAHRDVLIDDVVAEFLPRTVWVMVAILLGLLAIDIGIFRRALRPLVRASELARRIGPARPDIRLPTDEIPNEMRPLVMAVNRALDRLEQGYRAQREFAADAAHELRTPLTVLRTRIDTLEDKQSSAALLRDVEAMSRVVHQLLDIAELDSFTIDPDEKTELRGICADVAEFIAPLALAQGKNIALAGETHPLWVKGNGEMLHRAIRNLVENALNHTPEGTTVEIDLERNGTVHVLDQGPGIPPEERDFIFQRFWRGDRRRTGSAGLGLAIVRSIADAHSAAIEVQNRPSGGAQFSLMFSVVETKMERKPVEASASI